MNAINTRRKGQGFPYFTFYVVFPASHFEHSVEPIQRAQVREATFLFREFAIKDDCHQIFNFVAQIQLPRMVHYRDNFVCVAMVTLRK